MTFLRTWHASGDGVALAATIAAEGEAGSFRDVWIAQSRYVAAHARDIVADGLVVRQVRLLAGCMSAVRFAIR